MLIGYSTSVNLAAMADLKLHAYQVQIQGDGNNYTHEQMTVNSEMSSRSLDGAAGDQVAPVVNGPDKSTNITEVAPEPEVVEPEVVEPEVAPEPEVEVAE